MKKRLRAHTHRSIKPVVELLETRECPSTTSRLVGSTLQIRVTDSQGQGGFFLTDPGVTDNNVVVQVKKGSKNLSVTTYSTSPSTTPSNGLFLVDPGKTQKVTFAKNKVADIKFFGGSGKDHFTNNTGIPCQANGGDGNDTLLTSGRTDTVDGGSGQDSVSVAAGATVRNAEAVQILNVPGGSPQAKNRCGPNSAWRVEQAYGSTVSQGALVHATGNESLISQWDLGTTGSALVNAMNKNRPGIHNVFFSLKTHESVQSVVNEVAMGKPVVAMISAPGSVTVNLAAAAGAVLGGAVGAGIGTVLGNTPGLSQYSNYPLPNLHWIAVDGFDQQRQLIYYTDTNGGAYQISFADFNDVFNWNFGDVPNYFLQGLGLVPGTFISDTRVASSSNGIALTNLPPVTAPAPVTTPANSPSATQPAAPVTANLKITNAYLTHYPTADGPLGVAFSGDQVSVHTEFETQDLPAGASYVISQTVNGVTLTDTVNWGAGMPGVHSWYHNWGPFTLGNGTNQVSVTLDATSALQESSKADNSSNFVFMAA